jgi:hypothetical protein
MFNATAAAAAAAQYSSNYCMYNQSNMTNATNASQVVCVVDHPYLPKYSMDISIFSYMYTLFLAFGCYSALNPVSARIFAIKTIFNLANYTITGYGFFKDRVYRPYMKRVHPKLLRLLNIDDGINEIVVIKNGKVIHSFKTMELFVKNNPIKFVKEFSDEDSEQEPRGKEDEDEDQDQDHVNHPTPDLNADISDYVDYNKKCEQLTELIEAFKAHSLDDAATPAPAPETNEVQIHDESVGTSDGDDGDNAPDDYILDPNAYDFIIRNFYYEDAKTGETHSYVFKYDIFYKSEMVEKYDIQMIKDNYFSTRKFIGISLKTNNQKYNINLTSPSNYYLYDNSILNYSFLKWYMMKHHIVKLSRDYVISCIDNYVEMYRINPGKKILVHKNKFQLVDDETFNSDNDNDNDNDNDTDKDTHFNVNAGLGTDTDTDTDADTPADDTQNENNKEPRLLFNNNLEENHEMFDIEILDYE